MQIIRITKSNILLSFGHGDTDIYIQDIRQSCRQMKKCQIRNIHAQSYDD